ncbi:hypothetical protein AMATHDRAFT_48833 [Amanita thiersii Skay4041]|uniref:RRM domain-containing protein n=1 Tax=Amanita thiersii Skay4041 TaxID=703135 RepID=A0A2A9NNH7_9AGAR|nr:hypothetical protein AMATHDRAFT_48833 [Amanita thiersii Skay4041]
MSRLLVKNLPSYVTPARLKEYFEQKKGPGGTLTDVKVAHKRDGTSRRFGFIGFKTEQEAKLAQEWFDHTYLDSSRISVTIIEGVKGAPPPRPNKRPRLDLSPGESQRVEAEKPIDALKDKNERKNTQLDKFMSVMKPRTKKGPSWANEETTNPSTAPTRSSKQMDNVAETSNDESNQEKPSDEAISDLDWMKRHMSKSVANVDKVFEQSDDEDPPELTVCTNLAIWYTNLHK